MKMRLSIRFSALESYTPFKICVFYYGTRTNECSRPGETPCRCKDNVFTRVGTPDNMPILQPAERKYNLLVVRKKYKAKKTKKIASGAISVRSN
jgi:hypothetical protein